MGLDVSAKLLVGVHLQPMTEQVEKTKYNPDTGAPYKTVEARKYRVIEGTNIEVGDIDGGSVGLPEVVCACYDDENSFFLGIVVENTNSHRSGSDESYWARVKDFDPWRRKITEFLKKEFGYDGSIGLFLLNIVSY